MSKPAVLFNKIKNLPIPVKASIAFTVCSILQRSLSVITVPIFTRLLTTEQYGVQSVYTSWYAIIQIFATLNLSLGVFNNGMVKYENDRNRFQSSMLGLSTTVTLVLAIVYLLGMKFWDSLIKLDRIFMLLMFTELLSVPAFQFWSARQRFAYKYKLLVLVTLAMSVSSPVAGIMAVLSTEYKAEARVISYVLVQVVVGLIFYVLTMKRNGHYYVKKYWKFALAFNIPLIPHYLSGVILNQADRIMINNMVGTGQAAIYSIAYNLAYVVSLITTSINNSFVPYTYQRMKMRDYESIRKNSCAISLLVAAAIVVVIAFGPELIAILATKDYYDAIWIIPPVAVSVFIMFMYSMFVTIEFYFEKNKFIMVASCIGAVLNIVLNYIFINKCGYIAAGYTTLACYIVFMAAHYCLYRKIIKSENITNIYNIKFFLGIVFVVMLIMFSMLLLYKHIIVRYIFITIICSTIVVKRYMIINIVKGIRKK